MVSFLVDGFNNRRLPPRFPIVHTIPILLRRCLVPHPSPFSFLYTVLLLLPSLSIYLVDTLPLFRFPEQSPFLNGRGCNAHHQPFSILGTRPRRHNPPSHNHHNSFIIPRRHATCYFSIHSSPSTCFNCSDNDMFCRCSLIYTDY
jgi:hypothetical protein